MTNQKAPPAPRSNDQYINLLAARAAARVQQNTRPYPTSRGVN